MVLIIDRHCLLSILLLGLVAVAGVSCQQCPGDLNTQRQICEDNTLFDGISDQSLGQPTFGPRGGPKNRRPLRGAIFRMRDDDPEEFQEYRVWDDTPSLHPVKYFVNNCTVTTFSSADTTTEAEDALAEIVLDAFAATNDCENARASAKAQTAAIATAVAKATARTEVKFSGDCDASDHGRATALASVDGTAIAEAFAEAVAVATNDNSQATAAVSVEDIAVAIAEARAKATTDLVGGKYAGASQEVVQEQTTEVVADALAKVTAAAFCDGMATVNVGQVGAGDKVVIDASTENLKAGVES